MSLFSMPTSTATKATALIDRLHDLHTEEANQLASQMEQAEAGGDLKTFYELATKAQRLLQHDTAAALQAVPGVKLFATPPVSKGFTPAEARLEARLIEVASRSLDLDGRGAHVTFVSPAVEEVHAENRSGRVS